MKNISERYFLSLGIPAIILLCRGLSGKNIWTLNFRHNPLSNPTILRNRVIHSFSDSNKSDLRSVYRKMNSLLFLF